VEFTALNIIINKTNIEHINKCTFFRSFSSFIRSFISTQNIVVIEVRAESALEKDADTIPNVNKATTKVPAFETYIGNRSSPLTGNT